MSIKLHCSRLPLNAFFLSLSLVAVQATGANEIKPQDNFYQAINGDWYKHAVMPKAHPRIGGFYQAKQEMNARIDALFKKILTKSDWPKNSNEAMIVQTYNDWLDWDKRNELGLTPIQPLLDKIDSIKTGADLIDPNKPYESMELLHHFFSLSPTKAFLEDGTLAVLLNVNLPLLRQPDYSHSSRVKLLKNYVTLAYKRIGDPDPKQAADDFIELIEFQVKHVLNPREQRDGEQNTKAMSLAELDKRFPKLPLKALIENLNEDGYEGSIYYLADRPLKIINQLLVDTPVEKLKRYLKALVYIKNNELLTRKDYEAGMKMLTMPSSGLSTMPDDKDKVREYLLSSFPSILGDLYMQDYFGPSSQAVFEEMVESFKKVMAKRIKASEWMSKKTQSKALEKLDATLIRVGKPKNQRSMNADLLVAGDLFNSYRNIKSQGSKFTFDKIGEKTSFDDVQMQVLAINAFNNPEYNSVVFLLGILNKPFYDEALAATDKASIYGAIGMVIAHELTHSFDDTGKAYNKDGIKENWWAEEDEKRFNEKARKMVTMFNKEKVVIEGKEHPVDGQLTLGENIADFGGINIAFESYTQTDEYKSGKKINGKSPTKRFFEAYAKIWREKSTPQIARMLIESDVHSPAASRVNVPLKNTPGFYKSYDLKPGDDMYLAPEDRVNIW